jgi:hypothetical protein
MHFSPDEIVFIVYFLVFMGIQTVILMGYIDLRRKHLQLKEEFEKLCAEVQELKRK